MKICVVASCSSNSIQNPDLIWHSFPRDTFQREEWGDILGLRESEVTDQARVCSLHFKPKDYIANRNILKQHAIPSIRLGRKHVYSDDDFDDDDEYYQSETEVLDIKDVQLISEEETIRSQVPMFEKIKIEPESVKEKQEGQKEKEVVIEEEKETPERRPSRRAARLAAEKISKTVKKYGLGNSSKCDDRYLDREDFKDKDYNYNPVFDRRNDPSFQVRKEKITYTPTREKIQPVGQSAQLSTVKKKEPISVVPVKNSTPVRERRLDSFCEKRLDFTPSLISKTYNIDLIMECHEELLTSVQAEAILKEQMEYNMVMKTLRHLKNTNARIIYASANFDDDHNDDDSKNSTAVEGNETPVVPAQLSTAQQYEASINQRPGPKSSKILPKSLQPAVHATEPMITSVTSSVTIRPTNGTLTHTAAPIVPTPIIIGQPQSTFQVVRPNSGQQTVCQPQTILITTPNPTTSPISTSDSTSSNYKVLVDSRTGVVVGTLPSETTILQNSSGQMS